MLIDTHCHLDFERFDGEREQIVARAVEAGVSKIIVPALDLKNCPDVLKLTERFESVYAAVGVHPNSAAGWQAGWVDLIREFAGHPKVVAIGEIGLDYYWDHTPADIQHRALLAQLELAVELALPVILHNRESSADLLRLLAEHAVSKLARPGVLHSFSADWETAQSALGMGFYLGFTGPVTFKKANELRAIATRVPLDRILVETDAPFLAPQQHRGKRNEPAYVRYVAAQLAALHDLEYEDFAQRSSANALRLFGERMN